MEFPDLGKNCSVQACKQLDFLPVKCDACSQIFCKDHFAYALHQCPDAYKKDKQVPVCPLCNVPVSVQKGQSADVVVSRHIDNDCQSDTAKQKRKVYSNRCALKGCKQKELIPFKCESCQQNFCIRHRLDTDHECQGFQGSGRGISSAGAAAVSRSQTSSSTQGPFRNTAASKKPQQTNLSSMGRDLDRERRERQAATAPQARQPSSNLRSLQSGMSEDEAMARAIAASLSESSQKGGPAEKSQSQKEQEEADAALARALQASEQEARNRRQQPQSRSNANTDREKSCNVS